MEIWNPNEFNPPTAVPTTAIYLDPTSGHGQAETESSLCHLQAHSQGSCGTEGRIYTLTAFLCLQLSTYFLLLEDILLTYWAWMISFDLVFQWIKYKSIPRAQHQDPGAQLPFLVVRPQGNKSSKRLHLESPLGLYLGRHRHLWNLDMCTQWLPDLFKYTAKKQPSTRDDSCSVSISLLCNFH